MELEEKLKNCVCNQTLSSTDETSRHQTNEIMEEIKLETFNSGIEIQSSNIKQEESEVDCGEIETETTIHEMVEADTNNDESNIVSDGMALKKQTLRNFRAKKQNKGKFKLP